jgi:FkbM family methyltransferase
MRKRSYKMGRDLSRVAGLVEELGPLSAARLLFNAYGLRSGGDFTVPVPGMDRPVRLRRGGTDINVFLQIFAMGEYDLTMFEQSRRVFERYERLVSQGIRPLILDCGANSGMATLWWRRSFPQADIVAVEPSPDNFAALTRNTREDPHIKDIQAAIWGCRTQLRLENPTDSAWAFRFGECEPEGGGGLTTQTVTISDILEQENGRDRLLIVKIDIEGAEKDVFAGDADWIEQTPLIVIETHDEMQPLKMTAAPFFRSISKFDFEICFFGENAFVFLTPPSQPQ